MAKFSTGSLCLTTLIEKAKEGHSAFSKSEKNGKIYFNVALWENDEPDEFGNNYSMQLNSKEEKQASEPKTYIGNLKYQKKKEVPIAENDIPSVEEVNDLPF